MDNTYLQTKMKTFLTLFIIISIGIPGYSQDKKTFGTFVYKETLVNYEYTLLPTDIVNVKFFLSKSLELERKIQDLKNKQPVESEILKLLTSKDSYFEKLDNENSENKFDLEYYEDYKPYFSTINDFVKKIPDPVNPITTELANLKPFIDRLNSLEADDFNEEDLAAIDSSAFFTEKRNLLEIYKILTEINLEIIDNKVYFREETVYENTIENHQKTYKVLIESLFDQEERISNTESENLYLKLYYEMTNRIALMETQPIAANIHLLSKEVKMYNELPVWNLNQDSKYNNVLVKKVDLEFSSGTIKNIIIYAKDPKINSNHNLYRFSNTFPISISGKFDPEHLDVPIFIDKSTNPNREKVKDFQLNYILLSDLIRYDINLNLNTEDYSPEDTIITFDETRITHSLLKSKTSKILSARTFTDLSGVNADQPNGLIQIEIFRKFTLWHDYWQRFTFFRSNFLYQGFFSYIQPQFSLNKIEENNKYLNLTKTDSELTLNSLDLLRHKQFDFGLNLNIYNLNIQNYKSKIFLDLHYDISRSGGVLENDPSENLYNINNHTFGPSVYYQILPDPRYGFKIGYDVRFQTFNNDEVSFEDSGNKNYASGWFLGNFKINPIGSELFLRVRYSYLINEKSEDFLQVQLGYAFDLIRNKRF